MKAKTDAQKVTAVSNLITAVVQSASRGGTKTWNTIAGHKTTALLKIMLDRAPTDKETELVLKPLSQLKPATEKPAKTTTEKPAKKTGAAKRAKAPKADKHTEHEPESEAKPEATAPVEA
jgi:hypothetical protein